MRDTVNGLKTGNSMMIGLNELEWLQAEISRRLAAERASRLYEAGWVGEFVGMTPQWGWNLYDAGSRKLAIQADSNSAKMVNTRPIGDTVLPWTAIDPAGNVLELLAGQLYDDAGAEIVVPDDGVWRTLVARYTLTARAPGTIAMVEGSATIVGTGTKFLRYGAPADSGLPTRIRIDAADSPSGNDGSYTFATITDDENATLNRVATATEAATRFRVRASFFGAEPTGDDLDARWEVSVTWELVTRTTTRPADGLIAADVRSVAGVVSVIDRRHGSVAQHRIGQSVGCRLMPAYRSQWYPDGLNDTVRWTSGGGGPITYGFGGAPVEGIAMAPMQGGSHLSSIMADTAGMMMVVLLNDAATTWTLSVVEYCPHHGYQWTYVDNAGAVSITTGATQIMDVALIALPSGSGQTHMALWTTAAGSLFYSLSDDDGATWAAAVTIVASVDMVKVSAVLTRMNRIVLVTVHSAAPFVRYAFSDDLGATWDLDAGALYDFANGDASVTDVSVCEDDRGNLFVALASDLSGAIVSGLILFRGSDEGNPAPVNTVNWRVGEDVGTPDEYVSVEAVSLPNGHVAILAGKNTGGSTIHLVARRRLLHVQDVMGNTTSACYIGAAMGADGAIWTAGYNADEADLFAWQYVPVPAIRPFGCPVVPD